MFAWVCVCVRERERQTDMYVKELAYVIVEADRSKICWVGWQVEIQIRVDVAVWDWSLSAGIIPSSSREVSFFFCFCFSIKAFNCSNEVPTLWRVIDFIQSTDLNVRVNADLIELFGKYSLTLTYKLCILWSVNKCWFLCFVLAGKVSLQVLPVLYKWLFSCPFIFKTSRLL